MRVAVFGPTGDQGAAQVRRLKELGHTPILLMRRPREVAGAEARYMDFGDHASISPAIAGADSVLLNLPSTSFNDAAKLIAATRAIADAAAAASGLRTLVFNTSMPVTAEKIGYMAQDARVEMRGILLNSGAPAIIFQPGVFLDNLMKGWAWPDIRDRGVISYPHDETLRVNWICHDDLASLMIAAADRRDLAGRVFDVGGAEIVRGAGLAAKLSRAWCRELRFETLSYESCAQKMFEVFRNVTDLDRERLVSEMMRNYRRYNEAPEQPFLIDMTKVLEELPVRLTPIEEWAARQPLPDGWARAG